MVQHPSWNVSIVPTQRLHFSAVMIIFYHPVGLEHLISG